MSRLSQILFIQGGGKNVHRDWDGKLVASLRRELGPSYEIRYPVMPNEADPTFASWRPAIERELAALGSGAIVIGHSVGGTILINVIAARRAPATLGAIMLIATPFVGEGGWPSEDVEPTSDLAARLPSGVPVFFYHGDRDSVAPVEHLDLYARAIPQARVRRLAGRDHQLDNDLTAIASDVRDLERIISDR